VASPLKLMRSQARHRWSAAKILLVLERSPGQPERIAA
jgi:hypothetical protein